jgi:hypothetical protein
MVSQRRSVTRHLAWPQVNRHMATCYSEQGELRLAPSVQRSTGHPIRHLSRGHRLHRHPRQHPPSAHHDGVATLTAMRWHETQSLRPPLLQHSQTGPSRRHRSALFSAYNRPVTVSCFLQPELRPGRSSTSIRVCGEQTQWQKCRSVQHCQAGLFNLWQRRVRDQQCDSAHWNDAAMDPVTTSVRCPTDNSTRNANR